METDQQQPGGEENANELQVQEEMNGHGQQEQMEDMGGEGEQEHYSGSIATALADQRISRKKASEDVKILANRIALLKAEEQKAWKKIEETKKKAQDILEVRQRNIVKTNTKDHSKQQQMHQEAMQREALNQRRLEQQNAIMDNQMAIRNRAHNEAFRLKQEKQQHEEMVAMQKRTEELKNKSMKQMIRSQKAEGVNLREQEKMMKRQMQRMDLINRINEENDRRKQIENEVGRLESEEAEWIKKLQHTNQLQSVACSEYETALTNDPEQLQQMSAQKRPQGKR